MRRRPASAGDARHDGALALARTLLPSRRGIAAAFARSGEPPG